jgi:hypothetical protein
MQACLSSSGNVANRFNPMNEVLILYQFNLGTGLYFLVSNRRIARQSNDEELVPEALGVMREGYRLNEVVCIHARDTRYTWPLSLDALRAGVVAKVLGAAANFVSAR